MYPLCGCEREKGERRVCESGGSIVKMSILAGKRQFFIAEWEMMVISRMHGKRN